MSEYIKREDALDMHFSVGLQDDLILYVRYAEVKDNIKHIPTADVELIRHGRWIRESMGSDNSSEGCFKISMAECSECGTCVIGKPNYCPNCGAKMDREAQENE